MASQPIIFGTDGWRGRIADNYTYSAVRRCAHGFARYLLEVEGNQKLVVIGYDKRFGSEAFAVVAAEVMAGHGLHVLLTDGPAPTPTISYSVVNQRAAGAVNITASHNPSQYNGFKLIREKAIPISGTSGIKEIKNLALTAVFQPKKKGKIFKKEVLKEYIRFNLKDFNLKAIKPFKIVIDTANAAPGIAAPKFFKKTNCKIYHLYPELDGTFPNHPPSPHEEKNLRDLKKQVLDKKADLGIAFDGDGDRIIFVDEKGKMIPGDLITALLVKLILKENPGKKILCDIRSSNVVRDVVKEMNGVLVLGRIGHSFIKEKMRRENIIFQGELNGHYYLKSHYFCEAPFYVIFKVLKEMSESRKSVSELVKPFRRYYHSGEINFKVGDKKKVLKTLENKFKKGKVLKIDGLRIDFPDWWFNARASHTEPILRLVIEAKTRELMEKKKKELMSLIPDV